MLGSKVYSALLGTAVLLAAGPAFAAGLPQLDASKFAPQLVWLALTFGVLYLLMSKMALPRIAEVLEERQHRIDDSLKKAESLKAEAEAVATAYEKLIAEARSQSHDSVKTVRDKAAAEAAARMSELNSALASRIGEAEQNIAVARNAAVTGLGEVAVEVAAAAVERLAGIRPEAETVRSAVDAAMRERG